MTATAPKTAKTAKRTGGKTGSGSARGVSLPQRMKQINFWRDQLNPLAGIAMARARSMLEAGQRGEYADLQWTYKFVEERYPTLFALVERRTSPLLEMDWDIRTTPDTEMPADATSEMADQQAAFLREAYDRIDNLTDAIEHLAMASFRGFAHLQKQDRDGDGQTDHFEVLDQWNFVKAGTYGNWWWNPDANQTNFRNLPAGNEIKGDDETSEGDGESPQSTVHPMIGSGPQSELRTADFIIREVKRPVNPIALIAFLRYALALKDWTGFIEIFGIPGGVVIGPPNVPTDKEAQYQTSGASIAEGGTGYLPNGSDFKFNDSPRGVNPFRDFLRFQAEDVVLAGTGGLLTMLAESGSGTLAGGAHSDTFNKIARAEAKKISEAFQKQFDRELIEAAFPGQPVLAYFQLAANEETTTGEIVKDIAALSSAGYQVEAQEVSEKTGYTISPQSTVHSPQPGETSNFNGNGKLALNRVRNRGAAKAGAPSAALEDRGVEALSAAMAADLAHVLDRLHAIMGIQDGAVLEAKLRQFLADYPALMQDVMADPASARALYPVMATAMAKGLVQGPQSRVQSPKSKVGGAP